MDNKNYELNVSVQAQKFLDKLDQQTRRRLILNLEALKEQPYQGKPLRGSLKTLLSWKVGKYRVLYRINEEKIEIIIINIGLRKDIYKSGD